MASVLVPVAPSTFSTRIMPASTRQGSAKMTHRAKYLPSTMPPTDTGLVSSSWSVRLWRSSAKERMVSTGM